MNALVGVLALILDRVLRFPKKLTWLFPHPVVWMGAFISAFDQGQNRPDRNNGERRAAGVIMLVLLCALSGFAALLVKFISGLLPFGFLLEAIAASFFLSQRQLGEMVRAVAKGLENSLAAGRDAVRHLVGRDVEVLDAEGVGRAAMESLAENASDGVIAPLFWLMIFGLPGIVIYKAINTADSMVGHRNERYEMFGWASARLDDLVNLVPSRLTALLFVIGSLFVSGCRADLAMRAAFRDAPKHQSPNAGWPEAAMAGALGLMLGGPRAYGGQVLDLAAMGDGRASVTSTDIRKALDLYNVAMGLALLFGGVVVWLVLVVLA